MSISEREESKYSSKNIESRTSHPLVLCPWDIQGRGLVLYREQEKVDFKILVGLSMSRFKWFLHQFLRQRFGTEPDIVLWVQNHLATHHWTKADL